MRGKMGRRVAWRVDVPATGVPPEVVSTVLVVESAAVGAAAQAAVSDADKPAGRTSSYSSDLGTYPAAPSVPARASVCPLASDP